MGHRAIRYAASPPTPTLAAGYWGDILYMTILALVYVTVSIWRYKAVAHRARKTANLMRY